METFKDAEVIAGVATAGISHGALIADELNLPFTYVRPEPKKHGAGRQIEGKVPIGKKVVVIEDLIPTGGSSIKAIDALRRAGAEVLGLAAIFTYSFDHADQNLKDAKVPYLTLSDYNVMLDEAIKTGYIKAEEKSLLEEWRKDHQNGVINVIPYSYHICLYWLDYQLFCNQNVVLSKEACKSCHLQVTRDIP